MPSTEIMAKRPLLSSLLRISESYMPTPKGSPKLPGSFFGSCVHTSSMTPLQAKMAPKPTWPTRVPRAPMPAGTASAPGSLRKCCPTRPTDAIMATRPCLSSALRRTWKPCLSPTLVNPRGSKKPSGAIAPICSAGSKGFGGGGAAARPASGLLAGPAAVGPTAGLADPGARAAPSECGRPRGAVAAHAGAVGVDHRTAAEVHCAEGAAEGAEDNTVGRGGAFRARHRQDPAVGPVQRQVPGRDQSASGGAP
mmetsp:Transcript_90184/g.250552  ORF Transcript_90184/g.250552 Transcript_90184/m.250552 type:complete len:252 (+) Transcript_90184:186-941(+)